LKKKIALDLDGVVFDSENLFRVYSELYDVEVKNGDNVINNSKRTFQERYDWSKNDENNFYNTYAKQILSNANLMPGADIIIPKLMNKYDIIIVTARDRQELLYGEKLLNRFGLLKVNIYYNEHNKLEVFKKENVSYIIDDSDDICKNAANNNIKAFYFKNNAADKLENNNNIITVNNWGEIYKYLMIKDDFN